MRLVALLACHALWVGVAHSQGGSSALQEEISRQQNIYWSFGGESVEGYTVDRSLADDGHVLGPGFSATLGTLGPGDRWLDIGAGEGQAILDYFGPEGLEERRAKAQVVALSIEDRRTQRWRQTAASLEADKLRYLYSKRLREYSVEELGRFKVITDVIGGFSYTEDLAKFVEKVLGFLALNGSFFTVLQDVRSEAGENQPHYAGARFLTEIADGQGAEVKICSWLKSISCVEVTCAYEGSWVPPVESYRVRKVCDAVTVPALAPLHYQAGTPPERRFRLASPPPAPAPLRTEPVKREAAKQQ